MNFAVNVCSGRSISCYYFRLDQILFVVFLFFYFSICSFFVFLCFESIIMHGGIKGLIIFYNSSYDSLVQLTGLINLYILQCILILITVILSISPSTTRTILPPIILQSGELETIPLQTP